MEYDTYKVIHLTGMFLVFTSLGGLALHTLNGGDKASNKARGMMGRSHAVGMLLILLGGFGMLAKGQLGFPTWIYAKLTIWVILGGLLAVPYRVPAASKAVWFGAPLLGALAAFIAVYKPF